MGSDWKPVEPTKDRRYVLMGLKIRLSNDAGRRVLHFLDIDEFVRKAKQQGIPVVQPWCHEWMDELFCSMCCERSPDVAGPRQVVK